MQQPIEMPQEIWTLNNVQFYAMIIGDFIGMIFGFYVIFYIVENVRSCRRKVGEVDIFVREKSKELKRGASSGIRNISGRKKGSKVLKSQEATEERRGEEDEEVDLEHHSKVSFDGETSTDSHVGGDVESQITASKEDANLQVGRAEGGQGIYYHERLKHLNPSELYDGLEVLSVISEDVGSLAGRSRSQSYANAFEGLGGPAERG